MPSAAQRSASQYQVKMHSTATTRSSRYGATGRQKRLGVRRQVLVDEHLAVAVEDADVQGLGVQIDAAVVAILVRVEPHGSLPARMRVCCIGIQPTPGGVGAGRGLG